MALIAVVALVDWRVELDVAFGFLYVFPLILLGTVWPRWGIFVVAILCTALSDLFDPYPFVVPVSVAHDILVFLSLAGTGFYARAVTRNRRLAMDAEEQFEFFVKTSPAAIVTMTDAGDILLANAAAYRLFRAQAGTLPGRNIRKYIPALARIRSRAESTKPVQSAMQSRGERESGEGFLADVFFSTYQTALGPRVAAVIIDVSEALREREVSGLDQLLAGSRILVGAMFHEVRNVCSAMAINYETLGRSGELAGNKNFEALGTLVDTLTSVATTELRPTARESEAVALDFAEAVAELRLVLDPYCEEAGIEVHWNVPTSLPPVWADLHRLLQVFLNLIRNSERALADQELKHVDVTAAMANGAPEGAAVSIRVTDNGPGLRSDAHLFEPFQRGADRTGIGLYLSRALLRSFRGELRYEPAGPGCTFVIELMVAAAPANDAANIRPAEDAERADRSDATHPITVGR